MTRETCPGGWRLQALLEEGEAGNDLDELAHHLENCPTCQETLQDLAAPPDVWVCTARGLMDEARAEPALHHLVRQLKTEDPPRAEDGDLSFLQPADRPDLLGLLDRYEVQEEIGRGGMGVVLKALDPSLNRIVAIKVLVPWLAGNSTARRRFVREAKAAAAVCHDYIVTVHGVEVSEGLPYLVMQYVAGESLQARLDREGPLPVADSVRVGMQTASGLAAAHAQGLIHRDIKPANLLLEHDTARVKITDFGLARMTDDVGLTQNNVVAGTPQYMAPEQARGEAVDHRADLFSLGSVLYTCCTGTPPFHGATALALLRQVSEEEPVPICALRPDVPAWLETFISRLMAKDAAQRIQSAAEAGALLEGYLTHLRQPATTLAPPLPVRDPAVPDSPRRRTHWSRSSFRTAIALLGLASLGLVGWLAAGAGQRTVSGPEGVYLDFRGGKLPPEGMAAWEGSDHEATIEPEQRGLHISLPADHHHTYPVGLRVNTTLEGDFEITGGYEVVRAETPRRGYGVGYEMYIPTDSAAKDAIAFARIRTLTGEDEYIVTQMRQDPEGKRKFWFHKSRAGSTSGRLRVTRRGSEVTYSVAEGDGGEFRELCRHSFCTNALMSVRMAAYPGMAPEAVDVRLVDVRIRSDTPIVLPAREAVPTVGLKKGFALLAVLLLALSLGLGAWFLWARRKRAPAREPAPPASEEKAPAAVPQIVSFSCPGCKANVKARVSLAGKRGKCPRCGRALLVPVEDAVRAADRPF